MSTPVDAYAIFIDTNVLVYATQIESHWHLAARALLQTEISTGCALWISGQIEREYLAAVTRPQASHAAMKMTDAINALETFTQACSIAEDGPGVRTVLFRLLQDTSTGGRQVYDANIVATMLAHGITRLMTFNTADFRRFLPAIDLVSSP